MSSKTPTEKRPERLVPGNARVLVQLYRSSDRVYSLAPGMSQAGVSIASNRELKRLWRALEDVINAARWRDINNQAAEQHDEQLSA